jgi:hypothetical protein
MAYVKVDDKNKLRRENLIKNNFKISKLIVVVI